VERTAASDGWAETLSFTDCGIFPGSVQPYPGTGTVVATVAEPSSFDPVPVPLPVIISFICPVQLVAKVESADSAPMVVPVIMTQYALGP